MSSIGPDRGAGYSLIPQSNSDNSELSDEELRRFYEDGFQIIIKKRSYTPHLPQKIRFSNNFTYRGLMNSDKEEIKANHEFPSQGKEMIYSKPNTMSPKRKFSFGLSIFVCCFTMAFFLMLPCEWANCSCYSKEATTRERWLKIITSIELKGPIVLVHNPENTSANILFMAQGSVFSDTPIIRTNYTSSYGGDIFAFAGSNGSLIWRKHYNKMPNEIDCTLFSIMNRPLKDCVIVSYGNYITVVSPENGTSFWSLLLNTKNFEMREIFPLVVPDMNSDSVVDLMVLTGINRITLISGLDGNILNDDFKNMSQNCSEIRNIRLHNGTILKLSCIVDNEHSELHLSLKAHSNVSEILPQHIKSSSSPIHIQNYSIQVTNDGTGCPEMCKTGIIIGNSYKTVWSRESKNSYTLRPVTFDFSHSVGFYGFIIKFWELDREDEQTKRLRMRQADAKLTVRFLYERTIIVLFNSTHNEPVRTINMSYFPIIQLYSADKSIEPDPVSQQYSLKVVDFENNGTYQLITYYSTFEEDKRYSFTHTNYILKSYVRTYLLENEIVRSLI